MKHRMILFLVIALGLISCLEEPQNPSDRFVKIFGKEKSSVGKKLLPLENDILILSNVGSSSFDFSSIGDVIFVDDVEDKDPGIIISDEFGNQKDMRVYPIHDAGALKGLDIVDIANRANFLDITQNADGSLFVIGEWRGITVLIDSIVDPFSGTNVTAPFIAKFSTKLDMQMFQSLNGSYQWDSIYHLGPALSRFPNGDIGLLLGLDFNQVSANIAPTGYSILRLSEDAEDTVSYHSLHRDTGLKFGRNMAFDQQGNAIIIGQRNNSIAIFKIPETALVEGGNSYDAEEIYFIDGDGKDPGINENPMYVLPQDDGSYIAVYFHAFGQKVWVNHLNSSFGEILKFELEPGFSAEIPRVVKQSQNGDLLIFNIHLPGNTDQIDGYLYRTTINGNRIFRKRFEGIPGDVLELENGDLLVLSNPIYNQELTKATITKMSANGELF